MATTDEKPNVLKTLFNKLPPNMRLFVSDLMGKDELITNEEYELYVGEDPSSIVWSNPEKAPTTDAINEKFQELVAEWETKKYQRDRLQEYPSIQELVVALYDEEDKASIIERRNAVKAKYPKPE